MQELHLGSPVSSVGLLLPEAALEPGQDDSSVNQNRVPLCFLPSWDRRPLLQGMSAKESSCGL